MVYFKYSSETESLSHEKLRDLIFEALGKLGARKKVLIIPPDFTRYSSQAGIISQYIYQYYGDAVESMLPALGTHFPMTEKEIGKMFTGIPLDLFKVHDWRNEVETIGRVPSDFVSLITEGKLNFEWPAQLNKMLIKKDYDLILSVGQIVPHEVAGFGGYNKNIFVGTGGYEGINKSHYVGAIYGLERIMGRADNPVRKLLNFASDNFAQKLPIVYVLTVIGNDDTGKDTLNGLYIGNDHETFYLAADYSLKLNFNLLDTPLKKVVVFLDPEKFKSTWLGNKAIYRTRMAIADDGELIILAKGIKHFGEDKTIDSLIRKYGYLKTDEILELVNKNADLQQNLGAPAHLIHGSSENRFTITYCTEYLTKEEINSVNYKHESYKNVIKKYDPEKLKEGFNNVDGEEIYYISSPASGLWASKDRFID
ncbi:lactate racemase domain-containing protein [Bacteroidota bacterium]